MGVLVEEAWHRGSKSASMPPKARLPRKGSTISRPTPKDASAPPPYAITSSQELKPKSFSEATMKVPPQPQEPTTILGPEMQALEQSLKEAALNTGRIFRFYADARKERIVSHAPYPQKSLTRDLGRSLERYDQICDTIETKLLHAISIFERDLKAEQLRIDAEASASVATRTRSKYPSVSPTTSRIPLPNTSPPPPGSEQAVTDSPTSMLPPSQFPPPSGASAIATIPRRHSAIVSSLHRPSFPLKLDLSATALAGNVDSTVMGTPMDVNVDLGLTSLPSPVTLAPKTARALPNDPSIPDIFGVGPSQAMPVDAGDSGPIPGSVGMKMPVTTHEEVIDLTGPETSAGRNTQLGDSADKPIELDLEGPYEEMDLFGDVEPSDVAANSTNVAASSDAALGTSTQLDVNMEELFTPQDSQTNTFQLDGAINQDGAAPDPGAILASLTSTSAGHSSDELSSLLPSGGGQPRLDNASGMPGQASGESFSGLGAGEETGPQFDLTGIDLSSFSGLFDVQGGATGSGGEDVDLMSLLAMDGSENVTANASGQSDTAGN